MPTYDYQCTKCNFVFEFFHKISESPQVKCPKCNSKSKKILSANSNIIFKGQGFYVNDYKKKENKKENNNQNKCEHCEHNKH